jgi:hypothetical protein
MTIALVIVLLGAGTSSARPSQNLDAKVRALATGVSEFSGRVTATNKDCVKDRRITITADKHRLGRTKTDKKGRFFLTHKSVETGTEVTFELKARGDACIPLVATLEAP